MERELVISSNLVSVGYDEAIEVLEVEFKSGIVYVYTFVPLDVYKELMEAESVGSYFAREIKNTYSYARMS